MTKIKKILTIIILFVIYFFYNGQALADIIKLDTILGLPNYVKNEKRDVIIFSSRYYINLIYQVYDEEKEIFWILPVDEIKNEDIENHKSFLEKAGVQFRIERVSEGLLVEEDGFKYKVVPYIDIKKVMAEKPDIILDIEFFFRIYYTTISGVNNEKTLEIMKFFRSLEEYNIDYNKIYLVLSKDISLPEWVNEFAYIIENIYPYWENKIFPESFVLLDEVEKYITFAQFEEAYEILLDVFPDHKENPYYYEKMMLVSARLFIFEDMLKAFDEGYKLNSYIIKSVPEVAYFLLGKDEYYPAYLLVKKAVDVEPWNKEIKELYKEIIFAGYNFYNNLTEDDELHKFFKEELNKINK